MADKHNIQWDNEARTVVLQTYDPGARRDDLYAVAEKSAAMLNSVDHTVHIIYCGTSHGFTMTGVEIKNMENQIPPNQGALVIVAGGMYSQMVKRLGESYAPQA